MILINTIYINSINNTIMDLEKLSKQELCVMCNDLGFTKYKSKSKSKLIELIYTKSKKPILENVVETDENVVETDENVVETNMELNKIYNEDCVTGMMKINDNSVDIIICDRSKKPYKS